MKRGVSERLIQAAAVLAGLIVCFPILYGLMGSLKSPEAFAAHPETLFPRPATLQNYAEALRRMPYARYLLNSLLSASLGTALRLVIALPAAYAFAFFTFKGKRVLFSLLIATMMLPMDTLLTTNYLTVARLGLTNSTLGIVAPYLVAASAMLMLRKCFETMPRALREAAQLDGCGDPRYLTLVLVPIAWPVIAALGTQSFFTLWNAYLWPLIVTSEPSRRTIQVGIAMLTDTEDINHTVVLAGAALTLPPALVIFVMLKKRLTGGRLDGSLVE